MTGPFSDLERRLVAGGATTLLERLADPDRLVRGDRDDAAVAETLDAWRDLFPSDAAFQRRLDRAGVSVEDCRRAIAADRLAGDRPVPDWVDRLGDLVAAVEARGFAVPEGWPDDPTDRPPFGRVTAAVAAVARQRLPDDPVGAVATDAAVESATEWLRRRLGTSFARVLYVECKSFVAAHDRERAVADPDDVDEPPTEYYEAFLAYLEDGGLADLCVEYPVFARLLATSVRQFDEYLREVCRRVRADREAIADRFGDGGDLGPVVDLRPLADDTHRDGRAVTAVAFESGVEVVYKPRSVEMGATFYRVLARLDEHLSVPALRTPAYLSRDDYGYVEFVDHEPCPDAAAVGRYYRRAGALLAVAYLLEVVDCQFENLVAAGEQPVLVDAETVLHPYFAADRRPADAGAASLRRDSVLLTGLLAHTVGGVYGGGGPDWNVAVAGLGLSSEPAELDPVEVPAIGAPNTDVMAVEQVPAEVDRGGSVPSVDGVDRPPSAHLDDLVAGFEDAYGTVLRLRSEDRLSEVGLPDAFAGVGNRAVYRPTVEYDDRLRSLCSWRALSDGADFGVELEALAVPFWDGSVAEPRPWPVYDAERRALARLDPPRFESRADGTAIRLADDVASGSGDGDAVGSGDDVVARSADGDADGLDSNGTGTTDDDPGQAGSESGAHADASGVERCRRRLEAAGRADLREQVELLRGSCGARLGPTAVTEDRADPAPVSDDRLREEARTLFERVRDAGLRSGGTYHWATIEPWTVGTGRPLSLHPVDDSLYFGRCGIALLGAALYRVTGEAPYRRFALDAVRPVRRALRGDGALRDGAALGGDEAVPRGDGAALRDDGAVGREEAAFPDDGVAPGGDGEAAPGAGEAEALAHPGGAVGAGSVAYGLAAVGDLLDEPGAVADAARVVDHLPDDPVGDEYDVVGGAAGTVLGLLAANDRQPSPALVEAAAARGDVLLDASRAVGGGRAWETIESVEPLTGFAHGAAGIGYALARLHGATGRSDFREAALDAVAYEASTYSPTAGNWPDYRRRDDGADYLDQWCHGRSGVGLARLGMADHVDDGRVERGIDRAVSTFDPEPGRLDHLCCGNAGRAAFLVAAEHRRGRRVGQARRYLGGTLARAEATGSYQLHSHTEAVVEPTLFMGLSGIAYAMLRATAPGELPAVLLWE